MKYDWTPGIEHDEVNDSTNLKRLTIVKIKIGAGQFPCFFLWPLIYNFFMLTVCELGNLKMLEYLHEAKKVGFEYDDLESTGCFFISLRTLPVIFHIENVDKYQ